MVTGASRGIGAGLAQYLSDLGASLGVCARGLISAPRERTLSAVVDVTDSAAVDEFAQDVATRLGPIDLWINNAGVTGPVADLCDVSERAASTVVAVNVLGVLHGSQSFVRHRRQLGGGGVLVNMSSGAARAPQPGLGLYCATKTAVEMLTDVVNAEEGDSGLRAYGVEPGVVDTDLVTAIRTASRERYASVAVLHELHEAGRLSSALHVAAHVATLAFGAEQVPPGRWRVPPEHPR